MATTCVFCGEDATWVHELDPRLARFRLDGEGRAFAGGVGVCDRCEGSWTAADDEALVARQMNRGDGEASPEADARVYLAVIRRADLGAVARDALLPPGAAAVRDAGFTPVEDVTGKVDVWRLWPEAHRRSVPETRPEWLDGSTGCETDERYWLVRSPWPGLTVVEVLNVLWRETERGLPPDGYDAYEARLADVARRLFALDEVGVKALRDG